jgi:hypothetical protein
MSIVNVKVSNIRPKYNNLQEWMKDSNNVYIGRKCVVFINKQRFPPNNSIWANPFKIDNKNDRKKVIEKYEKYIIEKIKQNGLEYDLAKLKNKTLGCWCYPESCHGDVLIKLLKNI